MATMTIRTAAEIGLSVKGRRERLGWSQADLARESGVVCRSLQNVEQGRNEPGLTTFVRLAGALGVTLDALYHGAADDGAG